MSEPAGELRCPDVDHDWVIGIMERANRAWCRLYHYLRIDSPCPIPPDGPGILICNHTSGLDPLLLEAALPRVVTWMIAQEYYELPVVRWVARRAGMIPTSRNGRDTAAMRSALRALEAGRLLGVFPEGRIEPTRQLLPFHPGVAMLAMRANVPVYPAWLDGTQRGRSVWGACLLPSRSILRFGPPIQFDAAKPTREHLHQATARFQAAIASLSGPLSCEEEFKDKT